MLTKNVSSPTRNKRNGVNLLNRAKLTGIVIVSLKSCAQSVFMVTEFPTTRADFGRSNSFTRSITETVNLPC
jgi:hypothetical protein